MPYTAGWPHRWVSSGATSYHGDWGWTVHHDDWDGPVPGYSYYLLRDGVPYLTSEGWPQYPTYG